MLTQLEKASHVCLTTFGRVFSHPQKAGLSERQRDDYRQQQRRSAHWAADVMNEPLISFCDFKPTLQWDQTLLAHTRAQSMAFA